MTTLQKIEQADQIESPLIRQLFAYWQSKCGSGTIPRRADIDPADILPVLPNVILVDFEQEPFRVRFRLVGTKIVDITGFEFTGKYLDEIAMPDVKDTFLECYETASRDKRSVFARIAWRFDPRTTGEYDFCVLPLEDDGAVATQAIAIECYARLEKQYNRPARGRPSPPGRE